MTVVSQRAQHAKEFFLSKGWKPWQADALVGNFMQESGFRDDVLGGGKFGDSGRSGYLAQWNGDRLRNLYKFSGSKNPTFDQQLEFVHHELTAGDERGAGRRLAKANDLYSATAAAIGYERPSGYSQSSPESGNGWANRLKYAKASSGNALESPLNNQLLAQPGDMPPTARERFISQTRPEADQRQSMLAGFRPLGGAMIAGGMAGGDQFGPEALPAVNDVNDDEYWSTVAPKTVGAKPTVDAPSSVGGQSPSPRLSRPASGLDTPLTETSLGSPSVVKPASRIASRVVYKDGTPGLEQYDPDAEANAKIEVLPEDGQVEPGNINVAAQPKVKNSDGSISTVNSISINEDGHEVLIPKVSPSGTMLSDEGAIALYKKTGKHLGKFDSVDSANAAGAALHESEAKKLAGSDGSAGLGGGEADDDLSTIMQDQDSEDAHSSDMDQIMQDQDKENAPAPAVANRENTPVMHDPDYNPFTYDPKTGKPLEDPTIAGVDIIGVQDLANKVGLNIPNYVANKMFPADKIAQRDAFTERYHKEHPIADIAGSIVGPAILTASGIGLAARGAGMAGKAITSALPKTEATLNTLRNFFTGASGGFGQGAGEAAKRVASKIGTGALEGAQAGAMQSGLYDDSTGHQAALGAGLGAILGGAGSGVQKIIESPTRGTLTQGAANVIRRAQQVFRDPEAVPTGGMASTSKELNDTQKRLFGSERGENQKVEAWTKEAMTDVGGGPQLATVENLEREGNRIGQDLDHIVSQAGAQVTPQLRNDFYQAGIDLDKAVQTPATRRLRRVYDEIRTQFNSRGGQIPGSIVQDLTRSKSELGKIIRGKDEVAAAHARGLQTMIMDAVDDNMRAQGATMVQMPGGQIGTLAQLYSDARGQWRALKVIEDSVDSGAGGTSGVIDPMAYKAAAEATKRGGRSDLNSHMQTVADTAQYMPKVTATGAAENNMTHMDRIRSYALANAPTALGLGSLATGIASMIPGIGLPGLMAAGASGIAAGALRDIPLKRIMGDPRFANMLMGDRQAISDLARTGQYGRRLRTAIGVNAENQREGR